MLRYKEQASTERSFPPLDVLVAGEIEASPAAAGEHNVRAFVFHNIPRQQVCQLTHALLELLLLCVWIAWHLCLGFACTSIKTRTQAPAGCWFCSACWAQWSAAAPPTQAGRAVRERGIISALAVLQQKASDDASLGVDRQPSGKPADVWLVPQRPTQPFLTTSDYLLVMIRAVCCLFITPR